MSNADRICGERRGIRQARSTRIKTNFRSRLAALALLAAALPGQAFAHGIGFTNTRIFMDPTSIATLTNRAAPGLTAADQVSFIMSVDTTLLNGAIGYYTVYIPPGATVVNAEFVNSAYAKIDAAAPTAMEDGWGTRGARTFTNWTATTGMGSIAVLNGDTGIFFSSHPLTGVYNPSADGTIATNVPGASIRTTSQLMAITATHNFWDANQTRAFGAGTANAAANTPSTAPVINTVGTGTTPFNSGSAVAGPDVGYKLDNTGVQGPWYRASYPNSYSTLGVPSAAAPVTVAGALAIVGVPTLAGAAFPLPAGTNAVRWALGAPRFPGTYYVRITLQFDAAVLASVNGPIVNSEATGSDADGSNGGKDNIWRYYQPAATTTANSALYVGKDIIAVNGVPSLNPATVPPGARLTYRIRYMNTAGLPQTNVVLSDIVPAQISTVCASITNVAGNATTVSNTCPAAGATVTFNVANRLNVGQGGVITFDMQTASSTNLTVTNTGRIVSTQNTTGSTGARSTLLQMPDLTISKSHVGSFNQGQVGAQYTITVNNTGNFDTSGTVTVTDTLPASLTATAAAGTGWTCVVGAPTTCTRSDALPAAASYPPITLTVNVAANAPTSVTNSAAVAGGGEANTANNAATDPTTIVARPDLTIGKTHVGNFLLATNGTYTITVGNAGTVATTGTITVTDTLPAGLSFVSATGTGFTCSAVGQIVTCTRATALAAGANVAITLTVAVATNATSPVQNVASVSGGGEANTANNTATDNTVILQPPLVAKTFSPSTVAVNTPSVLTITLTNPNPSALTLAGTAFTDNYPAGLVNTATPAPATTCAGGTVIAAAGGASLGLANGSVPANGSCTVTVNVRSATAGSYLNNTGAVATVGVGSGASASATLTVIAPAAPTIAKAFSPNPIENTIPTTLTITLVNPNPITINAVAFNDAYPPGFTNTATPGAAFTPASVSAGCTGTITGGAAGGASIGLAGGVMPANATCVIRVNVVAPVVGSYLNTTTAVTTTNGGVTATGATAAQTLTVVSPSPPFIAKVFTPAAVGTGDVSRLEFTITNPNGSRAIVGIAFTDTYPPGLVNAPTPNVVSTCANGTISGGVAGGNTIGLSGADIPILGSCTLAVDVVSAAAGSYLNTSGAVSSTVPLVGTGNTASATLTVIGKPTISKAFAAPTIVAGGATTLTLTLTNPSATALSGVAFTDSLPVNLAVASPNALANSCGGSVSAAAGSGAVTLSGGALAAGGSCTVSVNVTSSVGGSYPNTSGGVSSAQSGAAGAASNTAVLTVLARPTMAKSFSPTTTPTGAVSTLTLVISNPNGMALSGLSFTDNFPGGLSVAALPNVVNTCGGAVSAAAGGASASLAGGSVAAGASCTVAVDVTATLLGSYVNASGGVASNETGAPGAPSNSATLTIVAPGVPVAGFVYSDANHNLQRDGGEAGTGATLYAKLVQSATGPALQAVAVDPVTGAYQFATVPAGTYRIVIDNNPTLADITPTLPAGWLGTEAASFARNDVVVAAAAVSNVNFGAFNGSRLSGRVFEDNGTGGGVPNNGLQSGAEPGIARTAVRATDGSGAVAYDSAFTDGAGNYTLWIPAGAGTVSVSETNLSAYVSVGGAAGATGGAYSRSSDATTFTAAPGAVYSGVNFADVRDSALSGEGRQNVAAGGVVFYAHTFTPGTGGSVSFSLDAIANPAGAGAFTQVLLRDANCNGQLDVGEPVLAFNTGVTVQAGAPVCVIVKDSAPGNAPQGAVNIITLSADFAYTNASPALLASYTRYDATTVGSGGGLSLIKTQSTATPLPGTEITYTIFYSNTGAGALTLIRIRDTTPSYTRFVSALCSGALPAGITACTVTQPAAGSTGTIEWSLAGSLAPAAAGQVLFTVQVDP